MDKKQPIYDKSNLIDFSRKNIWMQGVQYHKADFGTKVNIDRYLIGLAFLIVIAAAIWVS